MTWWLIALFEFTEGGGVKECAQMTRRRNVLSREQRSALLVWLECIRPELAAAKTKVHNVAIMASKRLGFKCTKANITWMAEKHSLHWLQWQTSSRPAGSWRCPGCGGLIRKPTCFGCDLTESARKNKEQAQRHGRQWFNRLYRRP